MDKVHNNKHNYPHLASNLSLDINNSGSANPYSYRKEKETHQWIFAELSWVVLPVGTYAQQRWQQSCPRWQLCAYSGYHVERDMQPWSTTSFFDTGHLCYGQLTSLKTRYPLTSTTWSYHRLKFRAHQGHMLIWSSLLTKRWILIGSRAHVRLSCCNQGWVFLYAS